MEPHPVFLLTDFGTEDPYVGLMKSVLVEGPPVSPVVDLTHEVAPYDEVNAAFLLEYVLPDLPPNAIVLLVVDPEVGTERNIIAVETSKSRVVLAPDTGPVNGIEWNRAFHVENNDLSRTTISSTFHGRDWFAPVGRFLSQGGDLSAVGPPASKNGRKRIVPEPTVESDQLLGEIVHVDHFGNLISNVTRESLETVIEDPFKQDVKMIIGDTCVNTLADTYENSDGPTGVFGSFNRLEVAIPRGSAAARLDAGMGSTLVVAIGTPSSKV